MATYSDLPLELTTHPTSGDLVLKENELAVRQSIRNLVNLAFGDKPFHPELTLNLQGLLFENLTPFLVSSSRRNMMIMLDVLEPRAEIVDVQFGEYYDEGAITITVLFRVKNTSKVNSIDFYFDRIR